MFFLETKNFLSRENQTFECEALNTRNCEQNYQRYQDLAAPMSVYNRSLSESTWWTSFVVPLCHCVADCEVEWPQYRSVTKEEEELPLAYVITAFTDARNVELTLATIFRPHNSYCLHIDAKSDRLFR